jgi:peroxiredoxin-like protein
MTNREPAPTSQLAREGDGAMTDVTFNAELMWSGTGREGAGEIQTDSLALELSGPESMGGRGVGTNPEELLVSAVSSCFTATLFGVLRRAQLPVEALSVAASGTVTGFPGHARFSRIVVSPTILGGDVERHAEYEQAADIAHYRCLIGRTLGPEVLYEVGSVRVREDAIVPTPNQTVARREHERPPLDDVDARAPAWRAA